MFNSLTDIKNHLHCKERQQSQKQHFTEDQIANQLIIINLQQLPTNE